MISRDIYIKKKREEHLYWFVTLEGQICKSPLVSLSATSHPYDRLCFTRTLRNKLQ